jgi:hypothetical protein
VLEANVELAAAQVIGREALVAAADVIPLMNVGAVGGGDFRHVHRFAAGDVDQPVVALAVFVQIEGAKRIPVAIPLHHARAVCLEPAIDREAQPTVGGANHVAAQRHIGRVAECAQTGADGECEQSLLGGLEHAVSWSDAAFGRFPWRVFVQLLASCVGRYQCQFSASAVPMHYLGYFFSLLRVT